MQEHSKQGLVKGALESQSPAWEEAELTAHNRSEWRRSVAQCIHLD